MRILKGAFFLVCFRAMQSPPPTPRIIPDVNVILNGVTGKPNTINRRLYEKFQRGLIRFVLSEEWMFEFERIVDYPKVQNMGVTPSVVAKTTRELLLMGELIMPVLREDYPEMTDVKDWYLLDLLRQSQADALITQDRKLLAYGLKFDIPIQHPKDLF